MNESSELIGQLYDELHRSAARLVRGRRGSVAPSSLVHEVLIRVWRADPKRWQSEEHFRAVTAKAMRQVLVDRARRRNAAKRGGDLQRVELTELPCAETIVDLVSLDQALTRLTQHKPRCATVVELRLLGGMSVDDVARWLDISASTVKREWRLGRAWLISELDLEGLA